MNYGKMLIPPTTYGTVSDEKWHKAFGRVNFYTEKDCEKECKGGKSYEERVKEFQEKHAKKV